MPLFYFDSRDGETFVNDDIGLEFSDIGRARDEATRALAELAREVLPGATRREISIEVRNARGVRILRAQLWFEIAILL